MLPFTVREQSRRTGCCALRRQGLRLQYDGPLSTSNLTGVEVRQRIAAKRPARYVTSIQINVYLLGRDAQKKVCHLPTRDELK